MRDPARCARIASKLLEVWERMPDLRMGQLLTNLHRSPEYKGAPFYWEDDLLENRLDEILRSPPSS